VTRRVGWFILGAVCYAVVSFAVQAWAGGEGDPFLCLYQDGSWQYTSASLPTPTPSATPAPVASATVAWPTPTVEVGPLPTSTPGPTLPPPDRLCPGRALVNLNLRVAPGVDEAWLGTVPRGAGVWVLSEPVEHDGDVWAYVRASNELEGWGAVVYGGTVFLSYSCDTAWGVHVDPGANRDELLRFGRQLQEAGRLPTATVYGAPQTANLLYDAGWLVLARPFIGDCPFFNMGPERSASEWVDRAVVDLELVRYDWLVLSNECLFPDAEYAAAWVAAAVRRAERRGIDALVPTVFGTGGPELKDVPALAAAHHSDTMLVGWGLNSYPFYDGVALDQWDNQTAWTTFRLFLYQAQLGGLPVLVTEVARSWGEDAPVWDEYPGWIRVFDGMVQAVCFWYTAGVDLPAWREANLAGKLDALAQVLLNYTS